MCVLHWFREFVLGRYTKYEVGSMFYGYFNIALYGVLAINTIKTSKQLGNDIRNGIPSAEGSYFFFNRSYLSDFQEPMMKMVLFIFLHVVCVMSLTMSVYLVYGIHKRRHGFVKAAFIYGLVATVLVSLITATDTILQFTSYMYRESWIPVGCLLNFVALWMVHKAYKAIKRANTSSQDELDVLNDPKRPALSSIILDPKMLMNLEVKDNDTEKLITEEPTTVH